MSTETVIESEAESAVSLAVSVRKYVPGSVSVAEVTGWIALPKVTGAGPDARLQRLVTGCPAGRPSSVTDPAS
jgi:hypothetical protein